LLIKGVRKWLKASELAWEPVGGRKSRGGGKLRPPSQHDRCAVIQDMKSDTIVGLLGNY
jgi:hypothetical protein